jgi:hypothetical protein
VRPRLRRGRPATIEGFADHLRRRPVDDDPERAATDAGTLAGLQEAGRARLRPLPDEVPRHFAGYLTGHLLRHLAERGRPIDSDTIATATFYAAPLGDDAAQGRLDEPATHARFLHTYLMLYLEKKLARPSEIEVESLLASWLFTQLGVRLVADEPGKVLGRSRARRLARTFPEQAPGVTADGTR